MQCKSHAYMYMQRWQKEVTRGLANRCQQRDPFSIVQLQDQIARVKKGKSEVFGQLRIVFVTCETEFVVFCGAGKIFLAYRTRISTCFTWTDNYFLAHHIRISACFA